MLTFRKFAEAKDLYGFEKEKPIPKFQNDLPVNHFQYNKMFDYLSQTMIGELKIYKPFDDQIQWGNEGGAIRVRLTPNQGINIERLTSDLQGQPLWITKKLLKIKVNEYAGREDIVASDIVDHIKNVAFEPLDGPVADYQKLHILTNKIVEKVKDNIHDMFVYQEVKKVNDNNYNILFSIVGAGVGKLAHRKSGGWTPAGIIDVSYDPRNGSIRGIVNTVSVENDADPWGIDIPYVDSKFSPSQPMSEIVNAIINGLKFI